MKNLVFIILFGILLSSCGTPPLIEEQTKIDEKYLKLVLIKSKNISFYDFGLLNLTPEITLELFKLGKSIGKFTIKEREVCFIDDCAPKWVASKAFFGDVGYDTLFEEILSKKDIFDGIGKSLGANGVVTQKFSFGGNDFIYEHSPDIIYFKNLTSGVTVIIDKFQE
ncbi:MAG: hypothetical protein IKC84_04265 [Helicobacteraceae bacterium]|nr:hypothetical protein [Helicobacteraceae bacterium]